MTKPNFFIIGAPKCGTTSLADWLGQHPNVFMSPVKEPQYYSRDIVLVSEFDEHSYLALFADATDMHDAVGEASVWYLSSNCAVPDLLEDSPDAKFIVMLRNPLELAPSLHSQTVFNGDEDVLDFREAWNLQYSRAAGTSPIPRSCTSPPFLQYESACRLGEQLERLYQRVSRDRVLLIFLEDLAKNPAQVWLDTLGFLQLPYYDSVSFIPRNQAKQWRLKWIPLMRRAYLRWQQRTGHRPLGLGAFKMLRRIGVRTTSRAELDEEMHAILRESFADDVRLLGSLSGRDLEHWLDTKHG